jgi:hypothetical protein
MKVLAAQAQRLEAAPPDLRHIRATRTSQLIISPLGFKPVMAL